MTFMGKIFTLMIFGMSVLFMGFAVMVYATHTAWHERAAALKKQSDQLTQTVTDLNAELERSRQELAIEQAARRHALAALQTKLAQREEQLQQREAQLQELTATEGQTAAALQVAQSQLAKLTTEVEQLRGEIRTAQQARDVKFNEVARLTTELNEANEMLNSLNERREQLATQVGKMKAVMWAHGLTEDTPIDSKAPAVDGIVTAVSPRDSIEISIGSDDGLRVGHTLDVYRDNLYLGRVVIVETALDKAVAKIMPEFRRGSIRKGDRVATKLS